MYLSQMKLNLRSRDVRHELADRYELHRTLMQGFPAMLSDDERVLYRVETLRGASYSQVILQSVYEPDWTQVDKFEGHYLYELPKVRPLSLRIAVGRRLPFRLQANPTVKRDGKRHGLYDDASLMNWP
jgi:CRISPR system Cascade subunit CasE